MKADDADIQWVEEPKLGLAGRMYVPMFVQGLTTTMKHLAGSLAGASWVKRRVVSRPGTEREP